MRGRRRLLVVTLVAAMALGGLMPAAAQAPHASGLVGTWYGEHFGGGTLEGTSFTARRWLRVFRADGTGRLIMRYYQDSRAVGEYITLGRWGFANGMFWTSCDSQTLNGAAVGCARRFEYRVDALTASDLEYTSDEFKVKYRVTRVPDSHRLP